MTTTPPPESHSARTPIWGRGAIVMIGLAVLYWLFQVGWFWRYCRNNINADAICYVGIARHIADGGFRASLHGYWSPLVSWLMAGVIFGHGDRTRAARLLMLPVFALCLILIYRFTQKLWSSRLLSALAILWFVAARGIASFSACFIGADLLLTATVVIYFTQLLRCLQQPQNRTRWIALGAAHGVAFLAKAIAMPLFAFSSALAVVSVLGKNPREAARALLFAAVVPIVIWASWGSALGQRYGVFTTGYQLHWNLLDPAVKQAADKDSRLLILHDTRAIYDAYMVTDAMPPGSRFWHTSILSRTLPGRIARKEMENIPQAAKELLVLLTPGGLLALILCVIQITRHRRAYPVHFRLIWIVVLTTAALVAAYGMLVFDGRYVIPVTPILMAFAVRFGLPRNRTYDLSSPTLDVDGPWQAMTGALIVIGLIAVQVYWASPFRTIRQDFQVSVHEAANVLQKHHADQVIAIGEGPYPEHGVGWEAGVYTAYFADAPIVAELFEVPNGVDASSVAADVGQLSPDAVMVWGSPAETKYSRIVDAVRSRYPGAEVSVIRDPIRGHVGTVLILRERS